MKALKSKVIFNISREEEPLEVSQPIDQQPKKESFATNTIVVCAYHCCGSTTYATQHPNSKDLEASMYSLNVDGSKNEEFPNNYIEAIKWHLINNNWTYLFVSCHEAVMEALRNAGIPFVIMYPTKERKEEIVNLCKNRGNDEHFLQLLSENYDNMIDKLSQQHRSYGLKEGEFISDDLFNNKLTFLKQ